MKLPQHIAFIMDGNGRWATTQGLPHSAGHKAGYEHIPKVLEMCGQLFLGTILSREFHIIIRENKHINQTSAQ